MTPEAPHLSTGARRLRLDVTDEQPLLSDAEVGTPDVGHVRLTGQVHLWAVQFAREPGEKVWNKVREERLRALCLAVRLPRPEPPQVLRDQLSGALAAQRMLRARRRRAGPGLARSNSAVEPQPSP